MWIRTPGAPGCSATGRFQLVDAVYDEQYSVAALPTHAYGVACVEGPCTAWHRASLALAANLSGSISFDSGYSSLGQVGFSSD